MSFDYNHSFKQFQWASPDAILCWDFRNLIAFQVSLISGHAANVDIKQKKNENLRDYNENCFRKKKNNLINNRKVLSLLFAIVFGVNGEQRSVFLVSCSVAEIGSSLPLIPRGCSGLELRLFSVKGSYHQKCRCSTFFLGNFENIIFIYYKEKLYECRRQRQVCCLSRMLRGLQKRSWPEESYAGLCVHFVRLRCPSVKKSQTLCRYVCTHRLQSLHIYFG